MIQERCGIVDTPAMEDLFQIGDYINGLSEYIIECVTPMTISIQGSWGSGKTSIMQMIKRKIGDRLKTLDFNSWQFSQFNMGNMLPFSMINYLIKELGADNDILNKATKTLYIFTKIAINTAGRVSGAGGNIIDSDISSDYSENIVKLKNELNKAIANVTKHHSKIVIFIDDLDRLEPIRAVELLEVLKNFLDLQNVVFVLAIDYDVIVRGVASKYGFDKDEMALKGKLFFDKIIQLPFKVPVSRYKISGYVKQCLEHIGLGLKDEQSELDIYLKIIQVSIGTNPRALKRLFNAYGLLLKIAPDSFKNDGGIFLFSLLCAQSGDELEILYEYFVQNATTLSINDLENLIESDSQIQTAIFKDKKQLDNKAKEHIKYAIANFVEVLIGILSENGKISAMKLETFKQVIALSNTTSSDNILLKEDFGIYKVYETFFTNFLEYAKKADFNVSNILQNINAPKDRNYIRFKSTISSSVYCYFEATTKGKSAIRIGLETKNNKIAHQWKKHFSNIQHSIQGLKSNLEMQNKSKWISSNIPHNIKDGYDEKLFATMCSQMDRLLSAIKPYC